MSSFLVLIQRPLQRTQRSCQCQVDKACGRSGTTRTQCIMDSIALHTCSRAMAICKWLAQSQPCGVELGPSPGPTPVTPASQLGREDGAELLA